MPTRVLIVDDVADNREMYCEYLRFAGCVTEVAGDAEEALAMLEAFRPDVVVMDFALPRIDGLEATRRIKASPATQEFETRAKNLLKGELKRRGITYAQLAERLAALDVHETERNLNNKISRGALVRRFCCNA